MKQLKEALEEAFRINAALPPCPATKECSQKYPQIDLLGKHSIIDTAFTYRTMLIEAACSKQPEKVNLETHCLLDAAKMQRYEMQQVSSMLHILELAGILHDLNHTREYEDMKKRLMETPVLKEYHKSLSAAEHMSGLKDTKISGHLQAYCAETLNHPFSMEIYRERNIISPKEAETLLPLPDKKHLQTCAHYSEPSTLKTALHKEKSGPTL